MREALRIALVGCGAVVERRHLPALARRSDCRVVALVDARPERAAAVGRGLSAPAIFASYRELSRKLVDAAVVALPNRLHADAAAALLAEGIHVLVEKPMACSVAEAEGMLRAAEGGGTVLAVGMTRRFLNANRFARWAIARGLLGRVLRAEVEDGMVFDWPLVSDSFFRRELAGGGALIDNGSHTLDQLLWWFGEVEQLECRHDGAGGVEAEAEVALTFRSGVRARARLSRLRALRNTARVRGERGELEIGLWRNSISLRFAGSPVTLTGSGAPSGEPYRCEQTQIELIAAEHDDFFAAVRGGGEPAVSGREALRSVALIEACYRNAQPLLYPWDGPREETASAAAHALAR